MRIKTLDRIIWTLIAILVAGTGWIMWDGCTVKIYQQQGPAEVREESNNPQGSDLDRRMIEGDIRDSELKSADKVKGPITSGDVDRPVSDTDVQLK